MSKRARYITTTIPYVNDEPHIGHALEFIQADALARYWRLIGHDVFFNTGTDEHGQKILQKAQEKGENVQAYVDHFAARFKKLNKEVFALSFDNFIRTTDANHIAAAQEMWRRCEQAGDIYKKKYSGLYCVGCERYFTEKDLIDGKCPDHQKAPVEIEEENYFFALSKYQEYLEGYLSQSDVIVPEWRRIEALQFVQNGLEDFSISREKSRMGWGVPVPGDESQVMYVWFDALTNYVSTLGWPDDAEGTFQKFWAEGEVFQTAGKDQIRFQSIMWQAMLKSAGVKATDKVFYHGFINSGGQKMSKSIGNVISPFDLVDKYGVDATRYMLLRHVHPVDDSDVTWERLDEWYEAHLVNGLGNLTSRILKMAETYGVQHPGVADTDFFNGDELDSFKFNEVLDAIWEDIQHLDEYIQKEEPFKKIKEDEESAKKDVEYLLIHLKAIGARVEPFMPETSSQILKAIKENKKPDNLFPRLG